MLVLVLKHLEVVSAAVRKQEHLVLCCNVAKEEDV
jgi:hypothetical protein